MIDRMQLSRHLVLAVRAALAALFGILVVFATMSLPGQFRHMAAVHPDQAHLRWPLTAITVFWVVCALVVVACTWRLLSLVDLDRIFTDESLPWVDAIVVAVGLAWVTFGAFAMWVLRGADDPGVGMLFGLVGLVVTVFGLLVLVLRHLLRRAVELRVDMDGVI